MNKTPKVCSLGSKTFNEWSFVLWYENFLNSYMNYAKNLTKLAMIFKVQSLSCWLCRKLLFCTYLSHLLSEFQQTPWLSAHSPFRATLGYIHTNLSIMLASVHVLDILSFWVKPNTEMFRVFTAWKIIPFTRFQTCTFPVKTALHSSTLLCKGMWRFFKHHNDR